MNKETAEKLKKLFINWREFRARKDKVGKEVEEVAILAYVEGYIDCILEEEK